MSTNNKDTKILFTDEELKNFLDTHKPEPKNLSSQQSQLLKRQIIHQLKIERNEDSHKQKQPWFWAPAIGTFAVVIFAFVLNNSYQNIINQPVTTVSQTQIMSINSTEQNIIENIDSISSDLSEDSDEVPTLEVGSSYLDFVDGF